MQRTDKQRFAKRIDLFKSEFLTTQEWPNVKLLTTHNTASIYAAVLITTFITQFQWCEMTCFKIQTCSIFVTLFILFKLENVTIRF